MAFYVGKLIGSYREWEGSTGMSKEQYLGKSNRNSVENGCLKPIKI